MLCMRCKIINTNDDSMSVFLMANCNGIIWLSFICTYQRQTETLTLCFLSNGVFACVCVWEMVWCRCIFCARLCLQITMFIAVLMISIHKMWNKKTNAEPNQRAVIFTAKKMFNMFDGTLAGRRVATIITHESAPYVSSAISVVMTNNTLNCHLFFNFFLLSQSGIFLFIGTQKWSRYCLFVVNKILHKRLV